MQVGLYPGLTRWCVISDLLGNPLGGGDGRAEHGGGRRSTVRLELFQDECGGERCPWNKKLGPTWPWVPTAVSDQLVALGKTLSVFEASVLLSVKCGSCKVKRAGVSFYPPTRFLVPSDCSILSEILRLYSSGP